MVTPVLKALTKTVLWSLNTPLVLGALTALIAVHSIPSLYGPAAHTLEFAVNEVLMTLFFATAGKEIREAMLRGGSLSNGKTAALPLIATVGGMLGPAALYVAGAAVLEPELLRGWAIPTATDIAFSALIAGLVFGSMKHPAVTFLLLLAIADDAAGLLIMALFYPTHAINLAALLGLLALACGTALAMRAYGLRSVWWYVPVFAISWAAFYMGGLHPSLSAVPLMWCLPHRNVDLGLYADERMDYNPSDDTLTQLEHVLHKPVQVTLLLFGFVNAGVKIGTIETATVLVTVALVVGKPLGICLATLFGVRALKLRLPNGMTMREVVLVGCAAGIGFTVSLFVSTVAFPRGEVQDAAKLGALFSLASAGITLLLARLWPRTNQASA